LPASTHEFSHAEQVNARRAFSISGAERYDSLNIFRPPY